jgi:hypothetical protein
LPQYDLGRALEQLFKIPTVTLLFKYVTLRSRQQKVIEHDKNNSGYETKRKQTRRELKRKGEAKKRSVEKMIVQLSNAEFKTNLI